MFRTIENFLSKEDWKNELVIVFGACEVDPAIPSEYVFRIPNSKFVKPEKFCARIDTELYSNGLTFVSNEAVGRKDGPALQKLQSFMIAEYYKHCYFDYRTPFQPTSSTTPMLGGLKDPSRSISQLHNMPWLLRFPLADKLVQEKIGLPVLVLMAGPSRQVIIKDLKRLAKHFLVICIARSLQYCLEAGVEPDFVVQYDTNREQNLFYSTIPKLKKTMLVSLSSANLSDYAWKFRGVFFRASFKQELLQNTYVLRDSTESSMLACMGLAEALEAPATLIAGADLSWVPDGGQYDAVESLNDQASDDFRIRTDGQELRVVGRDGRDMVSHVGYLAAAGRAAEFARSIQAKVGSRFFSAANIGILPEAEFPTMSRDEMFEYPEIDRDAYLEKIDTAANAKEKIDLKTAIAYFNNQAEFLRVQELNFAMRQVDPTYDFDLRAEFSSLMNNIRSVFILEGRSETQVHNLVKMWVCAFQYAAKIGIAYVLAKKDLLPVLCLDSEYEHLQDCIDGFFPKERLELVVLSSFASPSKSNRKSIDDITIEKWIGEQPFVFVSHEVLHQYRFFFDTLDDEKVVYLPRF